MREKLEKNTWLVDLKETWERYAGQVRERKEPEEGSRNSMGSQDRRGRSGKKATYKICSLNYNIERK